jgi:hypothetical protein
MAQRMTFSLVRSFDFVPGDFGQIEIASALQPDRVVLAVQGRQFQGFGLTPAESGGFGFATGLPLGGGVFGAGYLGQGAELFTHRTLASFVAGDYTVRLRAVDRLGNAGDWSDSYTIQHRPLPPAPTNLRIADGILTWAWSDP